MFGRTPLRVAQQQRVRRLDRAAVQRMFPPSQIAQWPSGYLPTYGVAHFLLPDGVSLSDILDCHKDLKADRQHELQRDFAADYTMWCRGVVSDFVRRLGDRERRRLRRFTARDRTAHDAEVRELFDLCPYTRPLADQSSEGRHYEFTPYAATQTYVMHHISSCTSPSARLHFATFPQICNIMHTSFDSMSPVRAISLLTGDDLVPTSELIQSLAFYLRRRVEEITSGEEAFRRSVVCGSSSSSDSGCIVSHSFSTETPVVCFFGNGRLAWLLNSSELLPFPVLPVQPPAYAASRERRQKNLISRDGLVAELVKGGAVAESFSTVFPCESISVGDALRKYRPCIALVEPHVDRDWLCDLRGFYSTREVLLLGPVDSPAMGSFAFPFLTFGVTPGPTTYWTYSDSLQRVTAANRIRMPMDPPHVSQGYTRNALDDISSYLLSPNDCHAFGCQYRCLRFVRNVYPVVKRQPEEEDISPPAAAAAASE